MASGHTISHFCLVIWSHYKGSLSQESTPQKAPRKANLSWRNALWLPLWLFEWARAHGKGVYPVAVAVCPQDGCFQVPLGAEHLGAIPALFQMAHKTLILDTTNQCSYLLKPVKMSWIPLVTSSCLIFSNCSLSMIWIPFSGSSAASLTVCGLDDV